MTIRYLADENIEVEILQGLRSREPAIEILDVKTSGLRGIKDPALLKIAVEQDHLAAGKSAPGVETLLLLWTASGAEEWRNQIVYLPLR